MMAKRQSVPHFDPCPSGKVRYIDRRLANKALTELRSRGGAQIAVYECSQCQAGWHLTSKRERAWKDGEYRG